MYHFKRGDSWYTKGNREDGGGCNEGTSDRGAGYIGSHTCVELLNAGHDIIVVDNSPIAARSP